MLNSSQGNIQVAMDLCMGVSLGSVAQMQARTTTTTSSAALICAPVLAPAPASGPASVPALSSHSHIENPAAVPCGRQKPGFSTLTVTATGEQFGESEEILLHNREVPFNETNGGCTFPSLMMVARPYLRSKNITPQIAQKERLELDIQVKSVLMLRATQFTEWLIQQGLVRSEQYCAQHSTNYQKTKFKLGMCSHQEAFLYSGGYVWISACCPDRFVSVFSGSIFQETPYTPTILLKLIYHWACQTNVEYVVSWVKVSHVFMKNFYTNLRSVCTAAIWDKTNKMGGKNSTIQVGVISLGTTSQGDNQRQVKVEVLGVLDLAMLDLRLRVCDPAQDGDRPCKRSNNIFHPLKEWVHTDSKIITDFTVDKSSLQKMGFSYVMQSAFSDQNSQNLMSNYHIMEYLKNIVPRVFKNTLSLLSTEMIQQFLDELVWREMYGSTSAQAFNNIVIHIAEQTRIDSKDSLLDRLSKIALNPFPDWSYGNINPPLNPDVPISNEQIQPSPDVSIESSSNSITQRQQQETLPQTSDPNPKRGRKRIHAENTITMISPQSEIKKSMPYSNDVREKGKENKNDQIQLQEFYYATIEGGENLLSKEYKCRLYFKCFLCTAMMRSNTDVMQHMIFHVPPQVFGKFESFVCRYCCTAFLSEHQMLTHVMEAHSNFGYSDNDMAVCAICEKKFGNSDLLIKHLSSMHYPSETPYRCESCGYRTCSHKDAIDHFYLVHERGEGLQCPYCLKVIQFAHKGNPSITSIHAFLLHMQRHIVRREQGRDNKCSRCCLWFNQKSSLKTHQRELHDCVSDSTDIPYSSNIDETVIWKQRLQNRRFDANTPVPELPRHERTEKRTTDLITINAPIENLSCQECEEDIDQQHYYPSEQKCQQCRYVTCCWRAFEEHQQQVHNERPMTGLIVISPLINIPLDRKMQCSCGYSTVDGNKLATHLIKCEKRSAYLMEDAHPFSMLDSSDLIPKHISVKINKDNKSSNIR